MKRIFIFTSVHRWNDSRIFFKEVSSLSKVFKVELHAPAEFIYKKINDISVFGLPIWKERVERRKTLLELLKRIISSDAEIFHFHDPELIFHGLFIKIILRKKVIYDIHENYTQTLKSKTWLPKYIRAISSLIYKFIEYLIQHCFDKLILAEASYTEFIKRNYVIIRNFPILHKNSITEKKEYDLVYLGGITKIRGINEILHATKELCSSLESFKMILIGPIDDEIKSSVTEFVKINDLEHNIIFTGRMPFNKAFKILRKAKIGISIIYPEQNYLKSISTKIFEYMECGIPVIYSDFPFWRKELDHLKIGLSVNPLDPQEIANSVLNLLEHRELIKSMGENGRKYAIQDYNWALEETKLLSLYRNL